jgi:uncharacterized protein (TIGR02594 family)
MAEREELQLVVTIDDQASAALEKLKAAMQELGSGALAATNERLRRQNLELTQTLRNVRVESERMSGMTASLVRGLTAVGGAITSIAGATVGINALKAFTDEMIKLDQLSKTTGFGVGSIKNVIDQMARAGVNPGAAAANIQGIANALANLARQGSELHQKLAVGARTDPLAMEAFIQRLIGFAKASDLEGATKEIFRAYKAVVAAEFDRTHSDLLAATKGKEFLALLGMTPEAVMAANESFKKLTAEQRAEIERSVKAAEKFNEQWVESTKFVKAIASGIQTQILPALTQANTDIRGVGEAWGETIGKEIAKTGGDLATIYRDIKQIVDFVSAPTWEKLKGLTGLQGGKPPISLTPGGLAEGAVRHFFPEGPVSGVPPIGDLMSGKTTLPAGGARAQPLLSTGWRGMPMSTNIEDRRSEESVDTLKANTDELRRLNEFLTTTTMGGAPGGALGFLGTQAGGLAPGLGGGTGVAGPLGGPMGGLPGLGGGGGGGAGGGGGGGGGTLPGVGGGQAPAAPVSGMDLEFDPFTGKAKGGGPAGTPGTPSGAGGAVGTPGTPGGNVRATWFQAGAPFQAGPGAPIWSDPSGRREGPPASGMSAQEAMIATPGRAGLGEWHRVTSPDGRIGYFRKGDVGPGQGPRARGVGADIGGAAAAQFYPGGPKTFQERGWGVERIGKDLPEGLSPGLQPRAMSPPTQPGTSTPGVDQGLAGPAALQIARQHLSEDEIRDEGKLSSFFNSQGIKISPRTTAWCAAFVNTSLGQAGVKGTGSLAAASFYKYGTHVDPKNVQSGDIAVWPHHVGFATGEQAKGKFEVLGGNQGGTVSGRGGVSTQMRSLRGVEFRRPPALPEGRTAGSGLDYRASYESGRELDKTPSVNVNGSGKISVEVKAPAGTKAGANGDGLFKKTEISRQVQMESAASGPPAAANGGEE